MVVVASADIIKYFKCNICNEYLTPPICQCSQGHIICSKCNENITECPQCEDMLVPVLNKIFGNIAKELQFPCVYKSNGCAKSLKWNEIKNHESECDFKNFDCPDDNCQWKGPKTKLQDHYLDNHKLSFIVATANEMHFDLDLTDFYHKVSLIAVLHCTFLLHVVRVAQSGFTNIVMQFVGPEKTAKMYNFEIELHTPDDSAAFLFKSSINSDCTNVHETTRKVIIPDTFLSENSKYECTLKIKKHNEPVSDKSIQKTDDKILKEIECPVCMDYMTSPIFQCTTGHSICNRCKSKITVCPTCKGAFGSSRNFALESVSSKSIVHCSFYRDGCAKIGTIDDMKLHQSQCKYGDYDCVQCTWRGKLSKMLEHVGKSHVLLSVDDIIVWNNFPTSETQIINVFDKPFIFNRVYQQESGLIHFVVQSFEDSTPDDLFDFFKSSYRYRILIGSYSRHIINADVCFSYKVPVEYVIANGKAISIPYKRIRTFAEGGCPVDEDIYLNFKLLVEKIECS